MKNLNFIKLFKYIMNKIFKFKNRGTIILIANVALDMSSLDPNLVSVLMCQPFCVVGCHIATSNLFLKNIRQIHFIMIILVKKKTLI